MLHATSIDHSYMRTYYDIIKYYGIIIKSVKVFKLSLIMVHSGRAIFDLSFCNYPDVISVLLLLAAALCSALFLLPLQSIWYYIYFEQLKFKTRLYTNSNANLFISSEIPAPWNKTCLSGYKN